MRIVEPAIHLSARVRFGPKKKERNKTDWLECRPIFAKKLAHSPSSKEVRGMKKRKKDSPGKRERERERREKKKGIEAIERASGRIKLSLERDPNKGRERDRVWFLKLVHERDTVSWWSKSFVEQRRSLLTLVPKSGGVVSSCPWECGGCRKCPKVDGRFRNDVLRPR